eukprot:2434961-Rhodomonas_salina.1
MSGTDIGYATTSRTEMSGTELGYAATSSTPSLFTPLSRILLPQARLRLPSLLSPRSLPTVTPLSAYATASTDHMLLDNIWYWHKRILLAAYAMSGTALERPTRCP